MFEAIISVLCTRARQAPADGAWMLNSRYKADIEHSTDTVTALDHTAKY